MYSPILSPIGQALKHIAANDRGSLLSDEVCLELYRLMSPPVQMTRCTTFCLYSGLNQKGRAHFQR